MANLTLRITLQTTNDDLRGGSWADLILKLRTSPALRERLQFTGTGGLAGGSVRVFDVTFAVPDSFQPTDIEYFQIRHVSQEALFQDVDNWNLGSATIDILPTPRPVTRVGRTGPHRFDGRNRVLTIPRSA
jgi:hypothetical protein